MLKMPFLGLWRLRCHCAVAYNAISCLLEIPQSLRGGSKSHIWAFGDCAVIVRWLRMPFLAFWRLQCHILFLYRIFFIFFDSAVFSHRTLLRGMRSHCSVDAVFSEFQMHIFYVFSSLCQGCCLVHFGPFFLSRGVTHPALPPCPCTLMPHICPKYFFHFTPNQYLLENYFPCA